MKKTTRVIPFSRAAKEHQELGPTFTVAPPWGNRITFKIPTFGFMTGLLLRIVGAGGVNGAAVVAAAADAPFNVINNILITDANGAPIVSLDGYSLFLARQFGGYRVFSGIGSAYGTTAINVGAAPANGNFVLTIPIFFEFGKDGLGSLPNMDTNAAYNVTITLNPSTAFYTTPPDTTVPTLTISATLLGRYRPSDFDPFKQPQQVEPPSPGTVQYWTFSTYPVVLGNNVIQMNRVGNIIRGHILIFRDATGTRALGETTVVPTGTIELDVDTNQKYIDLTANLRQRSWDMCGIDAPAGVVPIFWASDDRNLQSSELGEQWLQTVGSTKLQYRFAAGAPGSLTVLTCDVVPGSGNIFYAPLEEYTYSGE
jgi:hypothetical protein